MRLVRLLTLISFLLLISACSCRTRSVGEGNIPVASEGGILKDVHFAFDKYDLDASAQAVLGQNAKWLQDNSKSRVEIEGHCDERGTREYNMALGSKRARAVADYLRSLGIAEDRMSTVSYGKELPLDPGHQEMAWAKNRRAHSNVKR